MITLDYGPIRLCQRIKQKVLINDKSNMKYVAYSTKTGGWDKEDLLCNGIGVLRD